MHIMLRVVTRVLTYMLETAKKLKYTTNSKPVTIGKITLQSPRRRALYDA